MRLQKRFAWTVLALTSAPACQTPDAQDLGDTEFRSSTVSVNPVADSGLSGSSYYKNKNYGNRTIIALGTRDRVTARFSPVEIQAA